MHWHGFLLYVATDGKDWHGLKLEEVGPTFSCFDMPAKITPKIIMISVYRHPLPFSIFFTEGRGHLYTGYRNILWVSKGTKYWLQNRIDLQQWYPHGRACSSMVWFCPKLLLLLLSTPSPKGEENLSVLRSLILRIKQKKLSVED